MNSICVMCGERKSDQELCRTENPDERWHVCPECARAMLHSADLAGMWQRTDKGRGADVPALAKVIGLRGGFSDLGKWRS